MLSSDYLLQIPRISDPSITMARMFLVLVVLSAASVLEAQQDDGSPFSKSSSSNQQHYGLLINKFNVYHHSVSGSVYAVNSTTLFIKDFTYDGLGKDTYFWGGSTGTGPSPNGFIIPDQHGRTNVLTKADNKDFTLTLPDNKHISEVRWIAVYDLSRFVRDTQALLFYKHFNLKLKQF